MTGILKLPDELIVNIVNHTGCADLPQLSGTSRRIRGIVQEILRDHAGNLGDGVSGPLLRMINQHITEFGPERGILELVQKFGIADTPLRSIARVLREQYEYALTTIWSKILPSLELTPAEETVMSGWDANTISAYLQNPDNRAVLGDVTTLDLSDCKLKVLPEEISALTNLLELDLSDNQLSTLPDAIGELTDLEELFLGDNQLLTLPDAIGQLRGLRSLSLTGNQLSTLPDAIGELTDLEELFLGDNQLSTLPDAIGQLSRLGALYLWGNRLSQLPDAIGQLTNLGALELSNNHFVSLEALGTCPGLAYVGGNPVAGLTVQYDAGRDKHLAIRDSISGRDLVAGGLGQRMDKIGPDRWMLPMILADLRGAVGRSRQFKVVLVSEDGTIQPEQGDNRIWVPGQSDLIVPRF